MKNKIDILTELLSEHSITFDDRTNKIYFDDQKFQTIHTKLISSDIITKYGDAISITSKEIKAAIENIAFQNRFTSADPATIKEEQRQKRYGDNKLKSIKNALLDQDKSWMEDLDYTEVGTIDRSIRNILLWLTNDERYKDKFGKDKLTKEYLFDNKPLTEETITDIEANCDVVLGFYEPRMLNTTIKKLCNDNAIDPIRDTIQSLVWDHTPRLETFFIDTIKADDTELNRTMTRKWFFGLMKRIYEPGCRFDNMITLQDETEGTGKTGVLLNLVNSLNLASDIVDYGVTTSASMKDDKSNSEKLTRVVLAVFDEGVAMSKAEADQEKSFLAKTSLEYRVPFERTVTTYPVHYVCAATTNKDCWIKDYSDSVSRRQWIIECHGERHDAEWWDSNFPMSYYQQVIAETYYLYKTDTQLARNYSTLNEKELEQLSKIQQNHKTLSTDSRVGEFVEKLFTSKTWTKSSYNSFEEFRASYISCCGNQYLEKIPTSYITELVRSELNENRSTQYVKHFLPSHYIKKVTNIEGKSFNAFVSTKKLND